MGKTHDLAAKEEQVQPDLSLKMENDLDEVLRMAELIESELDVASGISDRQL